MSFTFYFGISFSSLSLKDSIDNKAILIPDYKSDKSNFNFEYLGKSRKIFYYSDISYLNQNKAIKLTFSPSFNYNKFKL